MHHVIQLVLDSETQNQVLSFWEIVLRKRFSTDEVNNGSRPHVTIMRSAPIPANVQELQLAKLAAETPGFELKFSHLGIFCQKPNILFLGVTPSLELVNLHSEIYRIVSPAAKVFDFAKPGTFVFHCTLGHGLDASVWITAERMMLEGRLPKRAFISRFDIVECSQAVRLLKSHQLAEKKETPNPQGWQ